MNLTSFLFTEITSGVYVYHGAVNTGILRWGERGLLIDCDDTLSPDRLREIGIRSVDRIYCTQHRRPNTAGTVSFQSPIYAPENERHLFEQGSTYWKDWRNRWHLYHFRPGPLAPLHNIPVQEGVWAGDNLRWGGFQIHVLDTPGMTDGAVSYVVQTEMGQRVVFCGDVLYGPGQVWDVHSLQKNMGAFSDYHGFLGATKTLTASLEKLSEIGADCLVPSHGEVIDNPAFAARLTVQRLEQLYRNYASTSALNFYFPHIFAEFKDDPWRMAPAPLSDFPDFILPVAFTSFAIRSESGALFLIDCGHDSVIDTLSAWKDSGQFSELEGCWVTHYHDDHVDGLHHLAAAFGAPIYTDEHIAEILAHPQRFCLPCISPAAAPVTKITSHGETWRWQEFEMTGLHFPGQSYYHGGLVVRGHGLTALFCGDSFAPTGMDDYTAGNRNFLGAGKCYRLCIDLVRQYRPDFILNQHQHQAFRFSEDQLDYMAQKLEEREELLVLLLPWEHPNYGLDEGWIRAYPYEVETLPGGSCAIEIRATKHTDQPSSLAVEAVLPAGWVQVEPVGTAETIDLMGEAIQRVRIVIKVMEATRAGLYPVGFRITWNGRYLGQVCHALVKVA